MKAVVQRVAEAHVDIEGKTISRIGPGILVLLRVEKGDNAADAEYLAKKICSMRIFEDMDKKMNHSILERHLEMLVVSQFTLSADCRKGNRPSFTAAEEPSKARELYSLFVERVAAMGIKVLTGDFGTFMQVHLVNDGPVTIILDTSSVNTLRIGAKEGAEP